MKCPQCNYDCPPEFKFCPQCGSSLEIKCAGCGFTAPGEYAFCPSCSQSLSHADEPGDSSLVHTDFMQPGIETAIQRLLPREYAERIREAGGSMAAERRLVTILFADISGSTALGESLDPEEVLEILQGAFEVMIEPVYRYEGTLARLMGDGVLAFFGAPISHEDDPVRAVHAGLDIVEGAQEYAKKVVELHGIASFNVRVGINTGLVVVGEVGSDLRVEYTAMGDAINLAARMEQNAPAGGVLITQDTYRHIQGLFDVQQFEPISVKGKTEPINAYLVESYRAASVRLDQRGIEGLRTQTVGREVELLALQNHFRDVMEGGETHLVTIVGEAGVGKTRLLDEFAGIISAGDAKKFSFRGSAGSNTQSAPFSLWRDLFARSFGILDSDPASVALEKFRDGMGICVQVERCDLVGQYLGFDFSSSPAVKRLLGSPSFEILARKYLLDYLRSLTRERCVVLLLDDLHWADDSSLDLLGQVVEQITNQRLLILCCSRKHLFERRPHWSEGLENFTIINLEPLSKRSSRNLVTEILQRAGQVPEEFSELLVEGAGGNPYYIEELIKMMVGEGVIETSGGTWKVNEELVERITVPETLTGLVQARLDRLPLKEKAVLQRASVVGRTFWDRVLFELIDNTMDEKEVIKILEQLRNRELVFRREKSSLAGAGEYTFKHDMLHEVTYSSLLIKQRKDYHRKIALWIESHAGDRLIEHYSSIARHYELAGENVIAAEYLLRSGEQAFRSASYQLTRDMYSRALELLTDEKWEENATIQARIAIGLGKVLVRLTEFDDAEQLLREGLSMAELSADQALIAEALNELANWSFRSNYAYSEDMLFYYRRGYQAALESGDRSALARSLRGLSAYALYEGDTAQAQELAERSFDLYTKLGDQQGLIRARLAIGSAAAFSGDKERARQYYQENLVLAQLIGDRWNEALMYANLGDRARDVGKFDEALIHYHAALGIYQEMGLKDWIAVVQMRYALLDLSLEKYQSSWKNCCMAIEIILEIQVVGILTFSLLLLAFLCEAFGEYTRSAELLGLARTQPSSLKILQNDPTLLNHEHLQEKLEVVMDEGEYSAAIKRGGNMDIKQVAGDILAECV